ncbi:nicotinamide N-methyltransferase-like [Hyperolius riggenbachi]
MLMRTNEKCIMEILKWQGDRTGAFCWGHAATHVVKLEGKSDDDSEAKELKLKEAITRVVKFDTDTESLADLIGGQQADCVISAWLLGMISENEEEYIWNLRKMIELLKPGGHLIILGITNASYYTCGEQKFHVFKYDENFAKKALVGEGMTILQCEATPRKSKSHLIDFDNVLFITACKQNKG